MQHLRLLLRHIYVFYYLSRKKNAEVIKFLEILKKYIPENKIYFCSRKKRNVLLNKNVIFVFHTIFKLDFIMQIIYCIIHRCLHSLFIVFLLILISVSKKRKIETMLTLSHSYNWQKFNNNKNEKRSQEYQSMDPEYVTGQINSCFLELLLRRFCCLIFCTISKIVICFSLIKRFPNDYKRYSTIYNC